MRSKYGGITEGALAGVNFHFAVKRSVITWAGHAIWMPLRCACKLLIQGYFSPSMRAICNA